MNAFIVGVGPITNNMSSNVIFDKLALWRGVLDNFALGEIRCVTISLASQDEVRIRRDIRRLISKKNIFL
jgi:hypothetical protein